MEFRHVINHSEIQECMCPGDVIAFSGGKFVSDVIMAITGGNVSHVGIVVPSEFLDQDCDEPVIAEVNHRGLIFSPLSDIVEDDNEILWWLPLANRPDEAGLNTAVEDRRGANYDYLQAGLLGLESFDSVRKWVGPQQQEGILSILLKGIVPLLSELLMSAASRLVERERLENELSEASLRTFLSKAINEHLDANDIADFLVNLIGDPENTKRLFCSEFVARVLEDSRVIGSIEEARTTPIELCLLEGLYAESVQFKGSERQEIRRHDTPDGA